MNARSHAIARIVSVLAWVCAITWGVGANAQTQNQNLLPQDHAYQNTLRAYLQSLRAEDLAIEIKPFVPDLVPRNNDGLCKLWVLSQHIPTISGVSAPADQFTLGAIEGGKHVMRPPGDPISLAWLASWDDPMNPYRASLAVKRRALAVAIVDMVMTDGLNERSPGKDWVEYGLLTGLREGRASHSDCLGGTLIWLAYVHLTCRDALPADARAAYETGLKKLVLRMNEWGPTRLMTDMDLFASVSLAYAAQSTKDPAIENIADAYTHKLYTDPFFFCPAGYWVDIQGYDASYNGISFYFANWAALASKRDDVRAAVNKAYLLKTYLALPEPDGTLIGPAHFSPRTSADSAHDQWGYDHRNTAGAMLSDDAMYLVDVPSDEKLQAVPQALVASLNTAAEAGAKTRAVKWSEVHWTGSLNYGFVHYADDFLRRRRAIEKKNNDRLRPPFKRDGTFVKRFGNDFVIAKYANFGAVIHTGPVGIPEEDWPQRAKWMPRDKPFGFSGGSLAAIWTPAGGSILLGRRGGAQGTTFDRYDEWRLWPIHAVTGQTADGRVFTSGRITNPKVDLDVTEAGAKIRAAGAIPRTYAGQGDALTGDIAYERAFTLDAAGVRIKTTINADGRDKLAELCETIPVYIAATPPKEGESPVTIHFKKDGTWSTPSTDYQDKIEAVKVKRFDSEIIIAFTQPQRVKLSPREWSDQYQSRATCRTILIDLLGSAGDTFKSASVEYTIAPAK